MDYEVMWNKLKQLMEYHHQKQPDQIIWLIVLDWMTYVREIQELRGQSSRKHKGAVLEERVKQAVDAVRNEREVVNLTDGEKGITIGAYREGWIDGWTERIMDIAYLIRNALSYFADTCPYCERSLNLYVDDKQIKDWLRERNG